MSSEARSNKRPRPWAWYFIVYSSGLIPLGRMIRYGLLLDLGGILVTVFLVSLLVPLFG